MSLSASTPLGNQLRGQLSSNTSRTSQQERNPTYFEYPIKEFPLSPRTVKVQLCIKRYHILHTKLQISNPKQKALSIYN